MGTQGKGEGAEPALSGKVKEILQEVAAAQARKVKFEEILNRISSYVADEPAFAFPLIDALGEIPTAQTAQLLEAMMAVLQDKKAVKGIIETSANGDFTTANTMSRSWIIRSSTTPMSVERAG